VAASFDTMVKVAAALQLTFDELLKPPERPQVVGRRSVTRKGAGLKFSTPNYDYDVHAPDLKQKRIIPLVMEVKSTTLAPPEQWSSHEGEEFIYILGGSIELHTEFYAPVILNNGDSAYIDSAMAHAFVNVGEDKAEMLSICLSNHLAQVNGEGPFQGQPLLA
jgi:quercetin dioxygenase-like cupin family protein